jgi:hypothetical protein
MNYPPYPIRSFTYRNKKVRADEVPRVIVYNVRARDSSPVLFFIFSFLRLHFFLHTVKYEVLESIAFALLFWFVVCFFNTKLFMAAMLRKKEH